MSKPQTWKKLTKFYDACVDITGKPPEILRLSERDIRSLRKFYLETQGKEMNPLMFRGVEVIENKGFVNLPGNPDIYYI